MHTKLTLTLLLVLLAVPCMVLGASPPPAIAEVKATLEGSAIHVSWQAPALATGIAYYRVYYSRQSIVGNGGDYDDFERTKGTETSYVFTEPPVGGTSVTFGVLAVSSDGIESEGFLTEATVTLPAQTPPVPVAMDVASSSSAASTTSALTTPASTPLTVIAVAPVSMTGILVAFSEPLSDVAIGPEAFLVVDGSGTLLPTVRIEVNGASVLVHTERHRPGTAYAIAVTRPLRGISGSVLDPSKVPPVRFIASGDASAPPSLSVPSGAPAPVAQPEPTPYVRTPLAPTLPIRTTPSPITPAVDRKPLTQSGPGMFILLIVVGALAGVHVVRRKEGSHAL